MDILVRVNILIWTLEPGQHIAREVVARRVAATVDLPRESCEVWDPVPRLSGDAIFRELRRRGLMPTLDDPQNEEYAVQVVGE